MRILHIMAGRGLGGAETYSGDIMLSLHAAGTDQCVVMAEDAPRYAEIKAAGVRMAPEILRVPFRFWQKHRLKKRIEREKPDIIHCWMRRAASITPRSTIPTIGWFGGYYNPARFTSCSHFVGVTKDITKHMVKNGVPENRALYVPTFPDVKDEPAVSRAAFNTPDDAFVALALSRLHIKKGLDILIRAAAKIPALHVWLAGEGPLRKELEKLVSDLKLETRVHFLGWRTDRAALLHAANVCVLPSRYEPFGTVILEAWAAGTPFIACKSAGPKAHVDDGTNGLLVEIDDVEGLTAALQKIQADENLARHLIENGRTAYLHNYTREAVTQRMLDTYKEIIASHSGT